MHEIPVAVLGATGMVGQRFVQLLADHPWFRITAVAASDRSVGKPYHEACHWVLPTPIPEPVRDLIVQPITPPLDAKLIFSALPSDVAGEAEEAFAQAGYIVCSNASAHRMDPDVPLLIPEVNSDHTALIEIQRARRGWSGAIVTSANCSTTELALAMKPLDIAFGLRRLFVVTLQAISGAGYPGVPSLDILGNIIPHIKNEEEKVETELGKLLGTFDPEAEQIQPSPCLVSAQCNRVPVIDGHTECISAEFEHPPASPDDLIEVLESFRGPREVQDLPSTPTQPIIVRREADRPQPRLDVNAAGGMAVTVGRVRPCPIFHVRFVLLGHNTLRGAAGGAIHNAELLVAQGFVQ